MYKRSIHTKFLTFDKWFLVPENDVHYAPGI